MHCTAIEVQTVVVCCRPTIFTLDLVYALHQQACRCCLSCVLLLVALVDNVYDTNTGTHCLKLLRSVHKVWF
jgi:hypothetical protein